VGNPYRRGKDKLSKVRINGIKNVLESRKTCLTPIIKIKDENGFQ
jgi:hypothetical protein